MPYSLGGNTELLGASCSDCEGVTSYLDGYLANAIYGHLRVHINVQSRSGHPETLPAVVQLADGERVFDLKPGDHPCFVNMPIWRPPGFMLGKDISEGFGPAGRHTYWYVPPNLRDTIGLRDGDIAQVIDKSPPHNLQTFARALMKIAYCNAVMQYGLDGFRPLVSPDIILGRYPNVAYFVGSDPTQPPSPYQRGQQHAAVLGDVQYKNIKLLTVAIRLFGDSRAGDRGMPFYTVVVGAEGHRKVVARPRLPRLPKKLPARALAPRSTRHSGQSFSETDSV